MKKEHYLISHLCRVQSYHLLVLCLRAVSSILYALISDCFLGLYDEWQSQTNERRRDLLPPKSLPSFLRWNMPAKQSNPAKTSGYSWHFIGSLCVNNLTHLHSVGKNQSYRCWCVPMATSSSMFKTLYRRLPENERKWTQVSLLFRYARGWLPQFITSPWRMLGWPRPHQDPPPTVSSFTCCVFLLYRVWQHSVFSCFHPPPAECECHKCRQFIVQFTVVPSQREGMPGTS